MNQVQDKVQVEKQITELNVYLDLMYHTLYKPRAKTILEMHQRR
ncbi:MAG: hypothetical protein U5J96_15575 [Ignavibacteriaceae bacterium]|nr:hypothetical protein [Ignavibacteriaceae bacterium]